MLQDIQDTINREFQKISSEFQANVPELDSKLKYTETEISALIESTEQQMLNSGKQGTKTNPNNTDDAAPATDKRPRTEDNDPSSIQLQVKTAITRALWSLTRPNRGWRWGWGRDRGRDGNRGGAGRYFQ